MECVVYNMRGCTLAELKVESPDATTARAQTGGVEDETESLEATAAIVGEERC